jgi:predicted site-specific integrase-resolvase
MNNRIAMRESEAAAHMGVSPKTLQSWRRTGEGPIFSKVGRIVIYRSTDMDEWLVNHQFKSTSQYNQKRNF